MTRLFLFLGAVHAAIAIWQRRSLRRFGLSRTFVAVLALLGLNLTLTVLLIYNVKALNPIDWIDGAFGPVGQALLKP